MCSWAIWYLDFLSLCVLVACIINVSALSHLTSRGLIFHRLISRVRTLLFLQSPSMHVSFSALPTLVVCFLVAGRVGLVCQALPFSVGVLCVSVDRQDPGVWSGLLVFACLQGRRGSACPCVPVRGRVAGPVARSLPFRVLCAVFCFGAVTSQLGRCAFCLRATRCEPTRTSSRQTLRPSCWMVSVVSLLRATVANHPEAPPSASPSRAPALPPRSP